MLARIVCSALFAGVIAGLLLSALQWSATLPLLRQAEGYEAASAVAGEAHEERAREWAPRQGVERIGFTVLANLVLAVAFALLLNAAYALKGDVDWRRGLLWGLAGFAAFTLAPALGLPPAPPGVPEAALGERQGWWLLAVLATAAGLATLAFAPRLHWRLLGLALLAAPHLIGAPEAPLAAAAPPEELRRAYALAVLATSAAFWLALGALSGLFFRRFAQQG